ncbi:MAG TPA: endonuclease/exonuclease/phosphatase family protein, partial [Lysobacter sp.]|nr:endonuclease/exonuclease/phosphatase family protein [Lysobacter sp.]
MRIISFNANGLRSAAKKGFFDWFREQDADLLCVQETKAQEHQLSGPDGLDPAFLPDGYRAFFRDATTKKGYSGVAIYSRREPDEVRTALGWA